MMVRTKHLLIAVFCLLLTGCAAAARNLAPAAEPPLVIITPTLLAPSATPQAADPLTWEVLQNLSYPIDGELGQSVLLVDGRYRGEQPSQGALTAELVVVLVDVHALGDLDGDGVEDAAVILMVNTVGTTGKFYHLIAVLNREGGPQVAASAFVGDRILVDSISIDGGRIQVDMVAPYNQTAYRSTSVRRIYALRGGALELLSESALLAD